MSSPLRKPKPVTRARLYETGIAIFGALTLWGVITADQASQLADLWEAVLPVVLLLLARLNVNTSKDDQ